MPGGNGTGPTGMGPMTGRGLGFCSGTEAQATQGFGARGICRRLGRSNNSRIRNRGASAFSGMSETTAKQTLEKRAKILQEELDMIKKTLSESE